MGLEVLLMGLDVLLPLGAALPLLFTTPTRLFDLVLAFAGGNGFEPDPEGRGGIVADGDEAAALFPFADRLTCALDTGATRAEMY